MNRAQKAAATLDNDFIKSALEDLKSSCHKGITYSLPEENAKREDFYYLLRAINCFEHLLKRHIEDGKVDEVEKNLKIKRIMR